MDGKPNGGVFNHKNLQLFSYTYNNPVNLVDPDGKAAGDSFASPKLAAADFGATYNDDSIRNNVEYFSAVYSTANSSGKKEYSYSVPNKGKGDTVTMDTNVKSNQKLESTVHSHANYDASYDKTSKGGKDYNNVPSQGDRDTMVGNNPEYVTTPNGSLIEYGKNEKADKVLQTDLPSSSNDPSRLNNSIGSSLSDDVTK